MLQSNLKINNMEKSEDLVTLVQELHSLDEIQPQHYEKYIKLIESVLIFLETQGNTPIKTLLEGNVLKLLLHVLLSTHTNLYACTAKLVAEIAKNESARQPCVEAQLIPPLLKLLEQTRTDTNTDVTVQACRALGNICFDNDTGRHCVDEAGGISVLLELLRHYKDLHSDQCDRVRVVACGFLLNTTNANETMQRKVIQHGGIELLNEYIKAHPGDENLCQMALLSLTCLLESDQGSVSGSDLCVTVGQLLCTTVGEELQDLIFELLTLMAENDQVKVLLVKSAVMEKLLMLIDKFELSDDEDAETTIRLCTQLIPTLLHSDESMAILYEDGKGKLYVESLKWLKSSNGTLQVTGALVIGNFAIKDENCISLVNEGVHKVLVDLLGSCKDNSKDSASLQHAVFSSLRNLAIPATNKKRMCEDNIIGQLLPFVSLVDATPVQFKILGTFRMLVDGQERTAKSLGRNEEFVKKIISWCNTDNHQGVKAESVRLLAWVIKHSRSSECMETIVQCGAVPHLCELMHSEHAVMQNEALVALTLIATQILDKVSEIFEECEVIPAIKVLITDDDTIDQILCNAFTLCLCLTKSERLSELMKLAEFIQLVRNRLDNSEEDSIKDLSNNILTVLNAQSNTNSTNQ